VYTDVSYVACARKLLAVPEAIYPQFATHNAHTLSAIYTIAGQNYYPGQYEFQCLHGMGEPLYEQVVGKVSEGKLNRPCRVYAPVGTHETCWPTWSAACWKTAPTPRSSTASPTIRFRSRNWSPTRSPASSAWAPGRQHRPAAPAHPDAANCGSERANSAGIDMANEHRLASLSCALLATAHNDWKAAPLLACAASEQAAVAVLNRPDHRDVVGHVQEATEASTTPSSAR
jgi:RHH-type proline utilization regulon transcriptional repressor/proline dehydrogenase/delta 1-pyrroline-5-carboxylate dehydrogenase